MAATPHSKGAVWWSITMDGINHIIFYEK